MVQGHNLQGLNVQWGDKHSSKTGLKMEQLKSFLSYKLT